jgi:hypothetical protein
VLGQRHVTVNRSARCAALAALLLAGAARAEEAPERWLSLRGRFEWITAGQLTEPRNNAVNPHDAVLGIAQQTGQTELRPDVRVEGGRILELVVRPRLLLEGTSTRYGVYRPVTTTPPIGPPQVTGYSVRSAREVSRERRLTWIDLFATVRPFDWGAVTYGLQNYQWGPAEALSPSNRIFHETGFTRDLLYVVRGKHLARVNLSAGQAFSAVVLAEVMDNGDEPFREGQRFHEKAALKLEWAARSGAAYLGVTGGGEKVRGGRLDGRTVGRGYVGEYGAVQLTDGLSAYADAVHQAGSDAWIPVERADGAVVFTQRAQLRGLRTLAVGGLRYTFTDGTDVRLEYVLDEAGWTRRQLRLAYRAASLGFPPPAGHAAAVSAWQRPGFEILGRQAAYASVTFVDLPPWKRTRLQLRFLQALEDDSVAAFATVTYDATGWLVVFASAEGTDGAPDTSLARSVRGMAVAGMTVSF